MRALDFGAGIERGARATEATGLEKALESAIETKARATATTDQTHAAAGDDADAASSSSSEASAALEASEARP